MVDDVPFIALDFSIEKPKDGSISLIFETNVGDKVILSESNPLSLSFNKNTDEPAPYIIVRDNLKALNDRKSFYRLVDLGTHETLNGVEWFGIISSGTFFPFIESKYLSNS